MRVDQLCAYKSRCVFAHLPALRISIFAFLIDLFVALALALSTLVLVGRVQNRWPQYYTYTLRQLLAFVTFVALVCSTGLLRKVGWLDIAYAPLWF